MDNLQLHDKIETAFCETFPNGWIKTAYRKNLHDTNSIYIQFGLIGDVLQLPSKLRDNDPVHHKFIIFCEDYKLMSSAIISGISINPIEQYVAMSFVKTKYRRISGDHARILKSFKNFFKRLKLLVIDTEKDIYQRDKYDDKFFTFEEKKKKVVNEAGIKKYVSGVVGKKAVHSPGNFTKFKNGNGDEVYSKTETPWGGHELLEFDGYQIAISQPPPTLCNKTPAVFYDYIEKA